MNWFDSFPQTNHLHIPIGKFWRNVKKDKNDSCSNIAQKENNYKRQFKFILSLFCNGTMASKTLLLELRIFEYIFEAFLNSHTWIIAIQGIFLIFEYDYWRKLKKYTWISGWRAVEVSFLVWLLKILWKVILDFTWYEWFSYYSSIYLQKGKKVILHF